MEDGMLKSLGMSGSLCNAAEQGLKTKGSAVRLQF